MTTRVVVTGPECTAKTTLAEQLGAHFRARWLPEMARLYATERAREGRGLTADDVDRIARRAIAVDDAALRSRPVMLVSDTDLLSTVTYGRHYYGSSSAWLDAEARARRATLYLLCAPDIPWIADGIRDRPEHREALFAEFAQVLSEFGANVVVVRGTGDARTGAAFSAVTALPGVTQRSLPGAL